MIVTKSTWVDVVDGSPAAIIEALSESRIPGEAVLVELDSGDTLTVGDGACSRFGVRLRYVWRSEE